MLAMFHILDEKKKTTTRETNAVSWTNCIMFRHEKRKPHIKHNIRTNMIMYEPHESDVALIPFEWHHAIQNACNAFALFVYINK